VDLLNAHNKIANTVPRSVSVFLCFSVWFHFTLFFLFFTVRLFLPPAPVIVDMRRLFLSLLAASSVKACPTQSGAARASERALEVARVRGPCRQSGKKNSMEFFFYAIACRSTIPVNHGSG
jgi:hypothetical protein